MLPRRDRHRGRERNATIGSTCSGAQPETDEVKASKKEKGKGGKKAIKIERRLNCGERERWMWLRGEG